jgi:hypothetical protein
MSCLEGQEMQKPIVVFWRIWIKGLQERGYMLLADTDSNLAICLEIECNSTTGQGTRTM